LRKSGAIARPEPCEGKQSPHAILGFASLAWTPHVVSAYGGTGAAIGGSQRRNRALVYQVRNLSSYFATAVIAGAGQTHLSPPACCRYLLGRTEHLGHVACADHKSMQGARGRTCTVLRQREQLLAQHSHLHIKGVRIPAGAQTSGSNGVYKPVENPLAVSPREAIDLCERRASQRQRRCRQFPPKSILYHTSGPAGCRSRQRSGRQAWTTELEYLPHLSRPLDLTQISFAAILLVVVKANRSGLVHRSDSGNRGGVFLCQAGPNHTRVKSATWLHTVKEY
jgi:hypothetical protein